MKIKTADQVGTRNALAAALVVEPQGTNLVAASTSVCTRVEDLTGGIVPPTEYTDLTIPASASFRFWGQASPAGNWAGAIAAANAAGRTHDAQTAYVWNNTAANTAVVTFHVLGFWQPGQVVKAYKIKLSTDLFSAGSAQFTIGFQTSNPSTGAGINPTIGVTSPTFTPSTPQIVTIQITPVALPSPFAYLCARVTAAPTGMPANSSVGLFYVAPIG